MYSVEHAVKSGELEGCEVFLFMYNSVVECAYYKGTSSNKYLSELGLQLRKVVMIGGLILHVIHISGKHMIKMGIDGLSSGDTYQDIAAGENMVEYMDLHHTCRLGMLSWT